MTDQQLIRALKGRRIVDVKLRKFRTGVKYQSRQEWTYNPLIILDNGAKLCFGVDETDVGSYGIAPILMNHDHTKPPKGSKNENETRIQKLA